MKKYLMALHHHRPTQQLSSTEADLSCFTKKESKIKTLAWSLEKKNKIFEGLLLK
jgi:hypothetical protein